MATDTAAILDAMRDMAGALRGSAPGTAKASVAGHRALRLAAEASEQLDARAAELSRSERGAIEHGVRVMIAGAVRALPE